MPWFAKAPRRPAQRRSVQTIHLPPPIMGLNTTDDPASMDPRWAPILSGLLPDGASVRARGGSKVHIDAATGVLSLLAFHGATSSDDRLFAVKNNGIYDVTTAGAALPAASIAFGTTTGNAGYANCVTMVLTGGPMLLVCDEVNGYHTYNPSGAAWTKIVAGAGAGQINGVDPATFTFVTTWKNRAWFIEGGTGRAWYLPVGQYAGTVSAVDFGNKFSEGGSLVGLYSWTHDGGAGVDDHLVAVSSNGDVLIYAGTDPATSGAFNLVGSWTTGGLMLQRRFAVDVGGDLWLWLRRGLLPVSALVSGAMNNPKAFVSYPVHSSLTAYGGAAAPAKLIHPVLGDGAIYCGFQNHGFLVSTATAAWCTRGTSAPVAMASFQGSTYEATASLIRYVTGTKDEVSRDGTGGTDIECEHGTPFLGSDGRWKTWTQYRLRCDSAPTVAGDTYFDSTDPISSIAVTPSGLDGRWNGIGQVSRDGALDVLFSTGSALRYHGLDVQFIPGEGM